MIKKLDDFSEIKMRYPPKRGYKQGIIRSGCIVFSKCNRQTFCLKPTSMQGVLSSERIRISVYNTGFFFYMNLTIHA